MAMRSLVFTLSFWRDHRQGVTFLHDVGAVGGELCRRDGAAGAGAGRRGGRSRSRLKTSFEVTP